MNKKQLKELIEIEIYTPYKKAKKRKLNIFDRFWLKHLSPETNAIYLVRKKEYFESKGKFYKALSRIYHSILMRRYGIHIAQGTTIGKGLKIVHPCSIAITLCDIGENFTIFQNCTIGQKSSNSSNFPRIGNNVTLYANSCIIGGCKIADGVIIGANSCLLHDALETGIYVGSPAKLIRK